jgi:hypothetical protein
LNFHEFGDGSQLKLIQSQDNSPVHIIRSRSGIVSASDPETGQLAS